MAKIAFLHPDLGIGGAERLIVDSALALQSTFKELTIWTCRYDPQRAFSDTKNFKIEIRGSHIPRHIFGFAHIFFALLSFLWLTIQVCLRSDANIFIVDQISAFVFLLKWFKPKSKIIFYCHFPDKRLASHGNLIKKIYRYPFDFIEKIGLKASP